MTRARQSIGIVAIAVLTGLPSFVQAESPGKAVGLAAGESRASMPLECARRDLQTITQLEQQGQNVDIPGEVLHNAFMRMISARNVCREGRVGDGLALYDGIAGRSFAGGTQ